mgnify:CR=1 FL=1
MKIRIEIDLDDQDCEEHLTIVVQEIKQLVEQLRENNEKGEVEESCGPDSELH